MNIRRSGRAGKLSTAVSLALLVGFMAGGVAGYLGSGWFRANQTSGGGTRAPLEVTRITALGRLEPRDGIVTISGLPGDRIEEVLVQPGRQVSKGTPLVRLASHEERRLARDLVQTQLNEALAQKVELERQKLAQLEEIDAEISKIRSGQEQDLTAQDARIALITTQERLARTQLERLKSLKLTTVSQQELDQQELQVEQAERERTAAVAQRRKTLDSYQQSEAVALAKRKATEASFNRHLKEVPVESLAQNLKLADHRLQEATLTAPGTGQVLRILARAGESSGQAILEVGDTRHMVAVAEVHETDVQALRNWPAVSVTVTSPALKDPQGQAQELAGRLDPGLIGRMVARNTNFSPNPREDRDRRVVDVDVVLTEPGNVALAAQFVNLQVTVTFSRKER